MCAALRYGVRFVSDGDLHRDPFSLPANHTCTQRRLIVVAYQDVIAWLRIEGRI
jgi:hypothetical protein